mgnify:FL=1|jgi:hypothetical protein
MIETKKFLIICKKCNVKFEQGMISQLHLHLLSEADIQICNHCIGRYAND